MRIKNKKLEWNALIHDFNSDSIEKYNIFSESFKEDLILAIIQLRYEVSVMFKNLSFGTNNKEDIKQIFEYNKSKQTNDKGYLNNPVDYTSF